MFYCGSGSCQLPFVSQTFTSHSMHRQNGRCVCVCFVLWCIVFDESNRKKNRPVRRCFFCVCMFCLAGNAYHTIANTTSDVLSFSVPSELCSAVTCRTWMKWYYTMVKQFPAFSADFVFISHPYLTCICMLIYLKNAIPIQREKERDWRARASKLSQA